MERRYKLSDFHHLEEIARGRVGSIHLVKEKATGKRFVLKKRLRSECRGKAEHEAFMFFQKTLEKKRLEMVRYTVITPAKKILHTI